MKTIFFALLATCASACLNAAPLNAPRVTTGNPSQSPLGIYYSFEANAVPPASVFAEMQAELGRILAPADLQATWRALAAPHDTSESFPEIVVFRFQGSCLFDASKKEDFQPEPAGLSLAESQVADGHVLPFATVNCSRVRRMIATATRFPDVDHKNAALGRALARVAAHEIYHMLTGSEEHSRQGIQRSAHSRTDLTEPVFAFAPKETTWLRSWVEKQIPASQLPEPQTVALESAPQSSKTAEAITYGR